MERVCLHTCHKRLPLFFLCSNILVLLKECDVHIKKNPPLTENNHTFSFELHEKQHDIPEKVLNGIGKEKKKASRQRK